MSAEYASAAAYTATGEGTDPGAWVGREFVIQAPFPVELGRVADYCAMLDDPNPLYWDHAAAIAKFGQPVAPPATLTVWRWPAPWNPSGRPEHGPPVSVEVPLPVDTLINVELSCSFERPVLVGDHLTFNDRISAISPEKQTALGRGWFITIDTTVSNQRAQRISTYQATMFRFRSGTALTAPAAAAAAPSQVAAACDDAGVPALSIKITPTLCALMTSATRDYFPGHHDRDYARSQGVSDAYLNTAYYCGLMDRVALGWSGNRATLVKRVLRMMKPAAIGDVIRTSGTVRRIEVSGAPMNEVTVSIRSDAGLVAQAVVTLTPH
ncbi:MAG: MaoC family dehydratase N-terminal domain-containing protein [Burkholderiaceae bacterium]|nr:MaoC family dehydratase N-terminal domain-containing protein [Burkholderiaceae bacterium]